MIFLYINNVSRSSRGFSLMEALVSTFLLVSAILIALPYFHNSISIVKSFESKGKCEAVFQNALSRIEMSPPDYRKPQLTTKGSWLPTVNFKTLAAGEPAFLFPGQDPIIQRRFQRLGVNRLYDLNGQASHVPLPFTPNTYVDVDHNGVTSYTPLLLGGSLGFLGDLYGEGYCQDYKLAPPSVFRGGDSANPEDPDVRVYLRVRRWDLLKKEASSDCDVKYWPRARNQFSTSAIFEPHQQYEIVQWPDWIRDNYGFQVSLRADISRPNGTVVETCNLDRTYSLPQDFQNVMDYTKDLKVATVRPPNYDWGQARDDTVSLSNKYQIFPGVDPKLQPVFTNFYTSADGVDLKERPECSQDSSTATNFTLRLQIDNFQKEPGLIAMCLDTSKNWLRTANDTNWAWCQKNKDPSAPGTPGATVLIAEDKPWRSQGWVPCENLNFCGQAPDAVRVVQIPNLASGTTQGLRYEFDYRVGNDDNKAVKNRLWGCELKYAVALVDPAGNLSYVKDKPVTDYLKAHLTPTNPTRIFPSQIREVNPGIYFRPAPCYTCNCKPCKGKGGLFGGFFNWILVVVVLISFGLIGLALCLTGTLFGCLGSGGNYSVPDFSSAGYLACRDMDQGCKCGHTCKKVKAPGPEWKDDIKNTGFDEAPNDKNSCAPERRAITANGRTFNVKLAYKTPNSNGSGYDYREAPTDKVTHMDEVTWQQLDPKTGTYCFSVFRCNKGQWELSTETYTDPATNKELKGTLVGCYPVRTAYSINWSNNPNGDKPTRGQPKCIEVQYDKGLFNPTGGHLWSYAETGVECGNLETNSEVTPPSIQTNPLRRVIGRSTGQCAQPLPPLNGVVYTPAARIPITQPCPGGGGAQILHQNNKWAVLDRLLNAPANAQNQYNPLNPNSECFVCWAGCAPPDLAPNNPLTDPPREMLYYENYGQENLPLCQTMNTQGGSALPLDQAL